MSKRSNSLIESVDKIKLSKQVDLVNRCKRTGIKLQDALTSIGWTYDDLQYTSTPLARAVSCETSSLLDLCTKPNDIPVVSFFSGAGGVDLGFEASGYSHIALVEHNKIFCNTLRHNRKHWRIVGPPDGEGDVSNFEDIEATISPLLETSPFNGVFVGGPPCQPFSIAANQRFSKNGDNFKRVGFAHEKNGNLLFDYINLILRFKPAVFLIENVPGLIELEKGEQLRRAYEELEKSGYNVEHPLLLLASRYGIPQNRERLFIVGSRLSRPFIAPSPSEMLCTCSAVFATSTERALNHITRQHSAESISRYMLLGYGQRDQLGRVDRLDPRLPSKTVIAGGTNGGGRSHLHPYVPRTISVREAARLQTFPEDYEFTGPVARQFTQVGNAVPPVLAAQLAKAIWASYFS